MDTTSLAERSTGRGSVPTISIVIPVRDEATAIEAVLAELTQVMSSHLGDFEVIVVDDASSDGTGAIVEEIVAADSRVSLLRLPGHRGKWLATLAGFAVARAELLVTMDGDGQNDPADIARLVAAVSDGYDMACGWRFRRQDNVRKRASSRVANSLIRRVTGTALHDNVCGLKVIRASLVSKLPTGPRDHRYAATYAALVGANVTEVPVADRRRRSGGSKYGIGRAPWFLIDLFRLALFRATRPSGRDLSATR